MSQKCYLAQLKRQGQKVVLRFVNITVIKSHFQLLTALQNRKYLNSKPLGNFQDSQADFRKKSVKKCRNISESSGTE